MLSIYVVLFFLPLGSLAAVEVCYIFIFVLEIKSTFYAFFHHG